MILGCVNCISRSASDCLAFEGMKLFKKLEEGILAPGLCLFGGNTYLNSQFMATPYSGATAGFKDAYNFYQSQVRIQIECAFGMWTHHWSILCKAIPMNISWKRAIALVIALAKLQNFCINEREELIIPLAMDADDLEISLCGGVPLEMSTAAGMALPQQLLGGGHHDPFHLPRKRK